MRRELAAGLGASLVVALWIPSAVLPQDVETTRVSVHSDGTEGNADSWYPAISSDGRFVAFNSDASNLVIGDSNGEQDIFVHDVQSGITSRASIAWDGSEANYGSYEDVAISADGRYVAFWAWATNLVPNDTNEESDVFVRDRISSTTIRVSVASNGSQGNHVSNVPFISANGRYVAFSSRASNLVTGDTNGTRGRLRTRSRDSDHETRQCRLRWVPGSWLQLALRT